MTTPSPEYDWRWKPFDALSGAEVYDMLRARSAVFVVEQKCVYTDIDGHDADALHLFAYNGPALAGYLRVLKPGWLDERKTDVCIGRVLTTAHYRGAGLGQALLERALDIIRAQWPGQPICLHAQARLQRFYGAFGFDPVSDIHLEDDIPHMWMRRL
jgi:ElaA protein